MTNFRGQVVWDAIPRRPLDIQELIGDSAKAERVLAWRPEFGLEEGLARTVDHWRRKLGTPAVSAAH